MTWRDDIRRWLLEHAGKVWYEWGGQDLDAGIADCSGLVIELLKLCGKLPVGYDATAQGLANKFPVTDSPECGDLCVYGASDTGIHHVMIWVGPVVCDHHSFTEAVAGMVGGDHETTAGLGRLLGRGLFFRPSPHYRGDFQGYRRIE